MIVLLSSDTYFAHWAPEDKVSAKHRDSNCSELYPDEGSKVVEFLLLPLPHLPMPPRNSWK